VAKGFLLLALALGEGDEGERARREQFLKTAEVVKAVPAGSGVTDSWRLTLRDERLTHDAHFQSVDERAQKKRVPGGVEIGFVDSYRYNVAAYRVASLLGLAGMVPVSVERSWQGKTGAMTWWVDDVMMDEIERVEKGVLPPHAESWRRQVANVKLFSQLIYDTDRNQSNVLITHSWGVWMVDFTRAFRPWTKLPATERPERCARDVHHRLRALTREELSKNVGGLLKRGEIEGVLARRDLLLEHFEALIRERGESAVLY
jgi:hypothetical protein